MHNGFKELRRTSSRLKFNNSNREQNIFLYFYKHKKSQQEENKKKENTASSDSTREREREALQMTASKSRWILFNRLIMKGPGRITDLKFPGILLLR